MVLHFNNTALHSDALFLSIPTYLLDETQRPNSRLAHARNVVMGGWCSMGLHMGHLKNEVLIFGAALGFSHCLVHLMRIDTILSKIDQCLDPPHRL